MTSGFRLVEPTARREGRPDTGSQQGSRETSWLGKQQSGLELILGG
jgi:hypothetical protein